jgi:Protein of unknown function (DUF1592)/Protein of unknown function (DUF1595)/Protein of unknown function (DUF1587)/Protein of unknown function (DUF1588)/Protein of unknown function (DUF1585)
MLVQRPQTLDRCINACVISLILMIASCGGGPGNSSSSSSSSSSTSSNSSSSSSSGDPVNVPHPRIFGALEEPKVAAPLANPKLRRLSNVEYNNTIRDLLNIRGRFSLRFDFPDDSLTRPYANQGGIQEVSAVHIEALSRANLALVQQALAKQTVSELSCSESESEDVCVNRIIETFGKRAWRRPLDPTEAMVIYASYTAARQRSLSFEDGLSMALLRILMSSNFFYLPEFEPSFTETASSNLSAYELASRLSYFLWASTPDDELLSLADSGELLLDEVLQAQVARMLDDPKSAALVDEFARKWLGWDETFPSEFNDRQLVASMETETRLFLNELIATNAPAEELLTATYSFMDSRLKTHYRIVDDITDPSAENVDGFVRVERNPDARPGILGQGGIILTMSDTAAVHPAHKGYWITEKLLCNAPPPPDLDHAALVEGIRAADLAAIPTIDPIQTIRNVELLTAESNCQLCHAPINVLGFGTVLWHHSFGLNLGVLDGRTFDGPIGMSNLLASSPRLPMCILSHLMTYATGREVQGFTDFGHQGPEYARLYEIYQQTAAGGNRFQDLITAIVMNDGFRKRSSTSGIGGNHQ